MWPWPPTMLFRGLLASRLLLILALAMISPATCFSPLQVPRVREGLPRNLPGGTRPRATEEVCVYKGTLCMCRLEPYCWGQSGLCTDLQRSIICRVPQSVGPPNFLRFVWTS